LPVFDVQTDEMFAFPEEFLKMVLEEQWKATNPMDDIEYVIDNLDSEGIWGFVSVYEMFGCLNTICVCNALVINSWKTATEALRYCSGIVRSNS